MGYAVQKITHEESAPCTLRLVSNKPVVETHDNSIYYLTLTLIALQILDGCLTALGMYHFGLHTEGNPILRALMHQVGYIPALLITKGVAIGIICFLAQHAAKITWLRTALKGVAALYLLAAVLPWSIILSTQLLFS
ncbi:MAG: hypothetical protein KDD60_00635 [Bdellovibrionales bacterium]|nr:hypothetical protein [Bdellovibrionales bacterium]